MNTIRDFFNSVINHHLVQKTIRNKPIYLHTPRHDVDIFLSKNVVNASLYSINVLDRLLDNVLTFALTIILVLWQKARIWYYLNNWVYTTNHKRIAVNYFWFIIISGVVGLVLATAIRLEFAYPGVGIFVGDSLQYLSIATAHGVIMVFFMIMPLIFGAFGNFLLPTQLGVHDVAFPRLNSAAFWFLPAGLFMLCQLVCVERRYQRINCFNIRELESLLKNKFFADFNTYFKFNVNFQYAASNLRFKLNDLSIASPLSILSNYYLPYTSANNTKILPTDSIFFLKTPVSINEALLNKLTYLRFNNYVYIIVSSLSLISTEASFIFNYIFMFFYRIFIFFYQGINNIFLSPVKIIVYFIIFIIKEVWYLLKNETIFIYNFIKSTEFKAPALTIINLNDAIENAYIFIYNFNGFKIIYNGFLGFYTIFTLINVAIAFLLNTMQPVVSFLYEFNKFQVLFISIYVVKSYVPEPRISSYQTTKFYIPSNVAATQLHSLINTRATKTTNIVFKYDYKAGDYLPAITKTTAYHLYPTILTITLGAKQAPWFIHNSLDELLSEAINIYTSQAQSTFLADQPFFSLGFFTRARFNVNFFNLPLLSQKMNKLFFSYSMQQRAYNNWRTLKFSREGWRTKLLIARNQKNLFKKYSSEDNVFWSIERNAKDLLPGWAMITPFSARTRFTVIGKVDIGLMGVFLAINASIVSSANFLLTYRYLATLNNRKMRDAKSFFTEAVMVTSWMMILANPMLAISIIMLLSDRHWQTSFFDYSGGGDTVLFQHMFWFFGHPEVYIIMVPVFGFANTILSYALRKRVSARASLLYSMYTIAFLGFFVWGHHMYMVGLAHTTRMLFSTLTVMISVPAATKLMHWCVTIVNSAFYVDIPLIYTLTFIFLFVSGGISGMCVAHTGMDVLFHDTFYVIGHFHVMLAGSALIGCFGGFYFYFASIFGVKYSRIYAYFHYIYYLIGQLMTVIPMFWLGYAGMPRRVLDFPAVMGGWHSVISAGHLLSIAGMIAFFIMIFDSLRQARAALRNNFGISRFNTRLNFYLYEYARNILNFQKSSFLFRYVIQISARNKLFFLNKEPLELTMLTYALK